MSAHDPSPASRLALAAVLATLTLAALPARAADSGGESVTSRISTAGLNLASPADQAILRDRIAVAANQVCQHAIYDDALAGLGYSNCYSQVRESAWAQARMAIAAAQSPTKTASRAP
jgi:UrcA family protein